MAKSKKKNNTNSVPRFTPAEDHELIDYVIKNINHNLTFEKLAQKYISETGSTHPVIILTRKFKKLCEDIGETNFSLEVKAAILKKMKLFVRADLAMKFRNELGLDVTPVGYFQQDGQEIYFEERAEVAGGDVPQPIPPVVQEPKVVNQHENAQKRRSLRGKKDAEPEPTEEIDHQEGTSTDVHENQPPSLEDPIPEESMETEEVVHIEEENEQQVLAPILSPVKRNAEKRTRIPKVIDASNRIMRHQKRSGRGATVVNVPGFLADFKRLVENFDSPDVFEDIITRLENKMSDVAANPIEIKSNVVLSAAQLMFDIVCSE